MKNWKKTEECKQWTRNKIFEGKKKKMNYTTNDSHPIFTPIPKVHICFFYISMSKSLFAL